jgi:hypothetical protein
MMRRYLWLPVCTAIALGGASLTAAAGEPVRLAAPQLDRVTAGVDVTAAAVAAATGEPSFAGSFTEALTREEDGVIVGIGFGLGLASGDGERSTAADTEVSGDGALLQIPIDLGTENSQNSLSLGLDVGVFR